MTCYFTVHLFDRDKLINIKQKGKFAHRSSKNRKKNYYYYYYFFFCILWLISVCVQCL